MAEAILNIKLLLKNLAALNKLKTKIKQMTDRLKRGFSGSTRAVKGTNKEIQKTTGFLSQSAERLGFMAFQFVFLQGIASRALGQIRFLLQGVFDDGAKGIDAMVRAIAQSGIDITGSTEDSVNAIDLLNDAILSLGGGDTIHNVEEVSSSFREIGKALQLTGTEMEKANKLIKLSTQVLRLQTIEQVQADEAAKNIIKTMNNFSLNLSEATNVVDTLIRVNQNSAITLDELTRSFGFAAAAARDFGLDLEETGAFIGLLADRLGQSSGAAGRNFRILLVGLRKRAFEVDRVLQGFNETLFDSNDKLKPFGETLNVLRRVYDKMGGSLDKRSIQLDKLIGLEVRGSDALKKLLAVEEDAIKVAIDFARVGQIADLDKIFTGTPDARIKRLTNSLEVLKIQFVGGFAPALNVASDALRQFIATAEVQEFIVGFGQALANDVIPVLKIAAQLFGLFAKFIAKNAKIVQVLSKALIGMIGLLVTLFIVGVVGTLVAALGSAFTKLAIFLGASEIAARGLLVTMLRLIGVLAAAAFIVIGVKTLFSTLVDGLQEGEEGIIAISAVLIGLGLALSFALGGVPGLIVGLAAAAGLAAFFAAQSIAKGDFFKDLESAGEAIEGFRNILDDVLKFDIESLTSNLIENLGKVLKGIMEFLAKGVLELGRGMGALLVEGWFGFFTETDMGKGIGVALGQIATGNFAALAEQGDLMALIIWGAMVNGFLKLTGIGVAMGIAFDAQKNEFIAIGENTGQLVGNALVDGLIDILTGGFAQRLIQNAATGLLKGIFEARQNIIDRQFLDAGAGGRPAADPTNPLNERLQPTNTPDFEALLQKARESGVELESFRTIVIRLNDGIGVTTASFSTAQDQLEAMNFAIGETGEASSGKLTPAMVDLTGKSGLVGDGFVILNKATIDAAKAIGTAFSIDLEETLSFADDTIKEATDEAAVGIESINREAEEFGNAIEKARLEAQKTFEEVFGSGSAFANPDFETGGGFTPTVIGKGLNLDQLLRDAGFDPEAIAAAGGKIRSLLDENGRLIETLNTEVANLGTNIAGGNDFAVTLKEKLKLTSDNIKGDLDLSTVQTAVENLNFEISDSGVAIAGAITGIETGASQVTESFETITGSVDGFSKGIDLVTVAFEGVQTGLQDFTNLLGTSIDFEDIDTAISEMVAGGVKFNVSANLAGETIDTLTFAIPGLLDGITFMNEGFLLLTEGLVGVVDSFVLLGESLGLNTEEIGNTIAVLLNVQNALTTLEGNVTGGLTPIVNGVTAILTLFKSTKETAIDAARRNTKITDIISGIFEGRYLTEINNTIAEFKQTVSILNKVQLAMDDLIKAMRALEAKISKTRVKFQKNDEGDVIGFSLVGGVTKGDVASSFGGAFAEGGVATKPTFGTFGEKGPEALIPLDRFKDIASGGDTNTVEININIEGNASQETVEEITEAVAEELNKQLTNKSFRPK